MESDFLDGNGNWECTKCGVCCKLIKYVYPALATEDGSCKYLKDNECSIYEDRPRLCRIPKNYPGHLRAKDCETVNRMYNKEMPK